MSETRETDAVRVVRAGEDWRYYKPGTDREFTYRHPYILELEITWACNLACPHCYVDAPRVCPNELTYGEICRVLQDAHEAGMRELSLTGGEVCCRPDLPEIIHAGRGAGFPVRLVTNGTLVTPEVARSWREAGVQLVTVSLDAMDPAVHDAIRGSGSFRRTMAGIDALQGAGIPVSLIAAFSRINLGQLEGLWEFARSRGMVLQVQMVSGKGRMPKEMLLSPEEHYRLGEEIARIFEGHPHRIVPMDDMVTPSSRHPLSLLFGTWQKRCTGGILNVFVRANGDVTPCSALALPENVVGNVREPGGFARILEEERCRSNLAWCHARNLQGMCAACPHAQVCHGGCPDILLTMCRSRHENEYCYHRFEMRSIMDALLDAP